MLDRHKNKGTLLPYLRNTNVRWFGFDLSDLLEMRFEEHEVDRYQARKGDLIICEGGHPGRAAIWDSDEPIYIQKALHRVRFHEPERAKWVLYWIYFKDLNGSLSSSFSGTGIQHFTKRALASFKIPLPPLDEQKRIVAVLDQAFAALDRARALVDANLSDTSSLYAAAIETLFEAQSEDWERGNVCELVGTVHTGPFGSLLHKSDYIEGGIPLINPANIVDGEITPNLSNTVSYEAAERLDAYKLRAGDLIIGRRGEMGRCAPVAPEMDGWICGTGCFVIRPHDEVLSDFIAPLLRRSNIVKRLTSIATGTTMLNLNNKALSNMPVEVPKKDVQRQILVRIAALQLKTHQSTDHYLGRLSHITQLRQSLLQRAFSGDLV